QSQQFDATVNGSSNTEVIWSVQTAGGGSISNTGLYTAPAAAGSYRIRATAAVDSRKFAETVVTVTKVAIAVNPANVTLIGGATQQFTATVSGSGNTGVTWSASAGTITATGLYTMPDGGVAQTVRATSQADDRKFAEAAITAEQVSISISPA